MTNSLKKQWLYDKRIYLIIFAVPSLIMFFVYAVFGVHPFGDNSVLVLDLNGQYVYYFENLRDCFWGHGSFIYSWSRNLSGEMFGVFAYYLASPFTLIPMLLPQSMMLGSLEIMQLCKIGAAAIAFAIYIRTRKNSKSFTSIIFSTIYALMAYSVVQLMNPMWLDGLVYLPLIILGLERLVDDGRIAGFIIPLALMFIANFYIGYMVGFFTAIYFVYYIFSRDELQKIRSILITILKLIFAVIVAVMCAMIILLPVYNSLKLGKLEFTQPDYTLKTQFTFEQFFTKLMPFSYDTVRPEGLPIVFCSGLTLLLIPLYFLNKNIKIKKKVANGTLLSLLFLCMYLSTIDIAWHGFQVPNWLPYRYSFVFCFIMILMAAEAFEHLEGVTFKEIGGSFFGILIFLFYAEGKNFAHFKPIESVLTSILVFVAYFMVLTLLKKHKTKTMSIVVLLFVCIELYTVTLYTLEKIDKDVVYSTYSSYHNYVKTGKETVNMLDKSDNGLYRSEKTFHRTVNDAMAFGLKGVSHSSSTMNAPAIELLRKLGFTSRGHYTKYNGATKVTDALLGIKYVLNKDKTIYDYNLKFTNKNIQVYENPNALSIGFMVDNGIKTTKINDVNPFVNQNLIIDNMTKTFDKPVLNKIFVEDIQYENINVENAGGHIKYSPSVSGTDAHIEFTITAPTDDLIYLYFPSDYERTMNIWVNHNFVSEYYEGENYCIMPIGKFQKGEKISIITTPLKEDLYMMDQCFYYLDKTNFQNAISTLKENQWNITKHSDIYIEGNITAKKNQIMYTSIPYENGWTIKVDGKKVEPVVLLDSLIGINVPEGTHAVTMKFMPDYFIKGIFVSSLGLILLILIIIFEKRSKKLLLNKLYD